MADDITITPQGQGANSTGTGNAADNSGSGAGSAQNSSGNTAAATNPPTTAAQPSSSNQQQVQEQAQGNAQGQTQSQTQSQTQGQGSLGDYTLTDDDALTGGNPPADATAPDSAYVIPPHIQEKYPDLLDLLNTTESMDQEEREYWLQILPIMTDEQIVKLRGIMVSEKEQLAKLDKEYQDELARLNEKHMVEWKEFETKEKREELETKEKAAESAEKQAEEQLLAQLQEM